VISSRNISQSNHVAHGLRCDGTFVDHFIINLLLSVPVKEFQISVNIW